MQIDPTKSAVQNLLALLDASNPDAPTLPAQVSVSNLTTGSFAGGADTQVTLTGTGPQGSVNFSGSVDVTYKRLALSAEAAVPSGPVNLRVSTDAAAALVAIENYFGFIPGELTAPDFTPSGTTGTQTVTLHSSGSYVYEDGTVDVDVNWTKNTVMLLHLDGTNGQTTTTDEAGHAMTIKAGSLTTSAKVFGTASYQGAGDSTGYIWTPDASDLQLSDFTLECFFTPTFNDLAGEATLFSKGVGSYLDLYQNAWYVSMGETNVHYINGVAANLVAGTTYHVALTRASGNITLWVNGQSVATVTNSLAFGADSSQFVVGGYASRNIGVIGNLDEVRVSNIARYSSTFTPPTQAFTLD
ncbi:hypothetical protein [Burkholderia phage FLC9]|nr:hypothetical protein [Burkholderia phage FLC9]